ncbi:UPF0375 protein ule-4 [Caenorhabditis elegans]|uniref:UPF0375 protein ule-4 n=1 Tax=Caenorhabditis elegans TaxID=6239 RepID=ULE4_CAEEL|nr:UPF0375 protein ule-4 [Caenorhabditis elegans]O62053.1 RecName: Full=UPF0375 protein ule-4; Flags: Precursor [Caenorhabditis elegans]CAB05678.1 UPF0375 protein ule-4 [Caenorhabditis elegans]|eukprot:NP_502635.1 UPF0375 protein ule-4 [Caenorhabditis elegans]
MNSRLVLLLAVSVALVSAIAVGNRSSHLKKSKECSSDGHTERCEYTGDLTVKTDSTCNHSTYIMTKVTPPNESPSNGVAHCRTAPCNSEDYADVDCLVAFGADNIAAIEKQ